MKKVRLRLLVVFCRHRRSRTHGWARVSQRFDGRAMAVDPTVVAATQPRWAAARSLPPAGSQCNSVCEPHRLPVASVAARVSQVANRLRFVLALATVGRVAGDSRYASPASASRRRTKGETHGRDYRQSERADHGGRRHSWLRRRQKSYRSQTTSGSRYVGADLGRRRTWRRCARPGRSPTAVGSDASWLWEIEGPLCGCGLRAQRIARLGAKPLWLDSANGVTAGRRSRLCRFAETLDR